MRRAAERERRQAGGHGLVGMQERIATLGGTLYGGPRVEGGYEVLVEIPLMTSDALDPVDPVEPVETDDHVETVEPSAEGPAEQAAPGRVGA
jgi:hypothetical protein